MKVLFKLLIGIIVFVLVVVGGLAIYLSVMFIDNSSVQKDYIITEEKSAHCILDNALVNSLEDIQTSHEVNFALGEKELDYLFHSVFSSINLPKDYGTILGSNVSFENDQYVLKISYEYHGFKTIVSLYLKISTNGNKDVMIQIDDAKIGKFGMDNPLFTYLKSKINQETLENSLKENSINVSVDFNQMMITFTKENLKSMIQSMMSSSNSSLINLLIDVGLNQKDMFAYQFTSSQIGAKINISSLLYDSSLKGTLPYSYPFQDLEEECESLLEKNTITQEDVKIVYPYLVNGYASLTNEQKEKIDALDLSTSISDQKSYQGIMNKSNKTLKDYAKDIHIDYQLPATTINFKIDEQFFNESIKNCSFVGYSLGFAHDSSIPNQNAVSYMTIEQCNMITKNENMTLQLIMNIHGEQVVMEANFSTPNEKGMKIVGNLNSITLGSIVLTEEQEMTLLTYLKDSVTEDYLSIDTQLKQITLDFESLIINNSDLSSLIKNVSSQKITTSIHQGYANVEFSLF